MTLLAFAANAMLRRRCCSAPAAVDRFFPPTGLTAANPPHAMAAAQDGTGRRTDRGTTYRYIDTITHTTATVYASSVNIRLK